MSLLNEDLDYAINNGLTWFDICEREQAKVDQCFINMSENQWIAYTRTITDIEKYEELNRIEMLRRKHFQQLMDNVIMQLSEEDWKVWCRILEQENKYDDLNRQYMLRNPKKQAEKSNLYWYTEYSLYPMTYFTNEQEQEQELAAIEEEVKNTKGIWRFGAIKLQKQEKCMY